MSWSTYVSAVPAGEIQSALDVAPLPDDLPEQSLEQVAKAKSVVVAIVKSGVVGDSDRRFTVGMSGHANPGHKPAAGWANDMISISISQAPVPEPAAAEPDQIASS